MKRQRFELLSLGVKRDLHGAKKKHGKVLLRRAPPERRGGVTFVAGRDDTAGKEIW
jgi:hypothetical protein